jgi:hypothetical protein
LTISDRSVRARLAAHERWAREPDRTAATAAMRAALDEKFVRAARLLNPALSDAEVVIRAANLRSAEAIRASRARWAKPKAEKVDGGG